MVRTLFHFVLAAMLLTSSLGTALAQERVYIDIDSPSFQKFPVAVTDFNRLSPPSGEDLTVWFSGTLSSYLNMTGYFNIISKSAFLETPAPPPQGYETINYPNWSVIGAEYLVRGTYRQSASQLSVEMRLYDVVKGQQLHGARYTGRTEDRIAIVRKMAGDILQVLTGDGRIFGTRIAYVAKKGKNTELRTILFDGTSQTEVTAFQSLTLAPRWSPDGRYLSFTSYKDGNPNFYIRDMRSGAVREASRRPGLNLSGAWSPDGRELLLTLSFEGNQEIYRMDVSSGQIKRLTFNHDIDVSPAWSPDGKQIVFVSNRSGSPQIYIMDRDGANAKRLTFEGNYNTSPAWSPRGDRIAFEGSVGGVFQIFTIQADGSGAVQLTQNGGKYPTWSPDGRYLAFAARSGWAEKIAVMNANGTNLRILGDGSHPAWSPKME